MARCRIATFGRHKVLVVERFDRRLINNTWWARLPQEDFCQACGLPSANKYEAKGGPGMRTILGILRGSDTPQADRQRFLSAQLLFSRRRPSPASPLCIGHSMRPPPLRWRAT